MIISSAEKRDSGKYILETFDSVGQSKGTYFLQLIIEGLLSMNPVCRFAQSDPCYGAVGRPLYLQLESEDQLDLKKSNNIIVQTNYEAEKPKDTFGVFVFVQVLEIIILLTLLGGFHIYTIIQRKQTSRTVETTEQEVQEGLYTYMDQEDRECHHRQRR
ncbi:hypothetical protein AOLI_G00174650 [Acnodon oligacanthus]